MPGFENKQEAAFTARLAQELLDDYINGPIHPFKFLSMLSGPAAERYKAKTRLYRLALVLQILHAEEKTDARLGNALVRLENLAYPRSSDQCAVFVLALSAATNSINDLLLRVRERSPHNDATPTWAQNWLAEIAVEERNVINAAQFASHWMKEVNLISDIITESTRRSEASSSTVSRASTGEIANPVPKAPPERSPSGNRTTRGDAPDKTRRGSKS